MGSVRFQFHGEPQEVLELALGWTGELGLHMALEQFFPATKVALVKDGDLARAQAELEVVNRAVLSVHPIQLAAGSADFLSANPDCLVVQLGSYVEDGLRESAISAWTEDNDTLRIWKNLVRRARSRMLKGASVESSATGTRHRLPNHRHTEGALRLARSGVRMLAFAGGNEFLLDDGA